MHLKCGRCFDSDCRGNPGYIDPMCPEHGRKAQDPGLKQIVIKSPKNELRKEIVDELENLLKLAKMGKIETFLCLYETTDYEGMQWTDFGSLSPMHTVGGIELLKQIVINNVKLEDNQ